MTLVNVPEQRAAQVGYDVTSRVLEVLEADGDRWRFFDVPPRAAARVIGTPADVSGLLADLRAAYTHTRA